MTSVTAFIDDCPTTHLSSLTLRDQGKMKGVEDEREKRGEEMSAVVVNDGVCAICLDNIELQETALVKGCEHAYCVNCILQWATYHEHPKCPQCKHPFESLSVHRALDGTLCDYMFEESVCLLVRASWFRPLVAEHHDDPYDELEEIYYYQYGYQYGYEEDEEDLDDVYFCNSSTLRIGNRRWGDNGYIRSGRQEARPVHRSNPNDSGAGSSHQRKKKEVERDSDASSSHEPKKKEVGKELMGRRAKRALKREAADKAAAAKHHQHLVRLGRQ
uniref:RING-type domain-containing protein n=1 Tax=Opuntia streptacantha TaxID=393608 RepID=A0A7C8YP93_OPUST